MPAGITTPSTTDAVDRLTLATDTIRGASANWPFMCKCNCAEFDAAPSTYSVGVTCMCAAAE